MVVAVDERKDIYVWDILIENFYFMLNFLLIINNIFIRLKENLKTENFYNNKDNLRNLYEIYNFRTNELIWNKMRYTNLNSLN